MCEFHLTFKNKNYKQMKLRNKILGATALLSLALAGTITAQIGKPFIHDPSTIMECDGKYYTFGTGGGGLISEIGRASCRERV